MFEIQIGSQCVDSDLEWAVIYVEPGRYHIAKNKTQKHLSGDAEVEGEGTTTCLSEKDFKIRETMLLCLHYVNVSTWTPDV